MELTKSYHVLARKYRPQKLSELVGQDVLVRTISNAIKADRIPHAFLLTGTRGVGKTTTARIISLSVNCIVGDHNGPTVDPCMKCDHCVQIINGSHQDVIEFDAASRTGVDGIRDIIDSCMYPPMSARYKVYIIDEVHMLSKSAFNALLKTLEEPPERIKFVFATTEIKKVPITVLSRCQKFFLRTLRNEEIEEHLSAISNLENIKYEVGAMQLLARAAEGSVRDGLSLLDQAISIANNETISVTVVNEMLSSTNTSIVCDLFAAILDGDAKVVMIMIEKLYGITSDPSIVLQDLLEVISNGMRSIVCGKDNMNDVCDNAVIVDTLIKYYNKLSMPILMRMWQILLKSLDEIKLLNGKMLLEVACMKLLYTSSLPTPNEILESINTSVSNLVIDSIPESKRIS